MAIKSFKATSAALRHMNVADFSGVSKKRPEKRLVESLSRTGGRNSYGRITTRHHGGGHKRKYRMIDFKRDKVGIKGRVVAVEYDPNRSAYIALVSYVDGDKRYILAPMSLSAGDWVLSSDDADIKPGNTLTLSAMPVGTLIHNIEMQQGKGGKLVRSAGSVAQLMGREGEYCQIKMPSGEMRKIHQNCKATVGQVSNAEHMNISIGKAGRSRWLGIRPTVRGVAMNPIDHPHGGGEGKTSGGGHPRTPWGQPTKGYKTRHNKRTESFIIKHRR
ncbi:MAG: 50S ribosomal protein L2 [Bacteriovoracia bacterium]